MRVCAAKAFCRSESGLFRMQDAVQREHEQGRGSAEETDAAARSFPDQDLFDAALQAGQVGVWSWDIKTNAVDWSGNLPQIHGIPADSFDGTFASFQKDIHPEDQPEVMAAIQESLRSGK